VIYNNLATYGSQKKKCLKITPTLKESLLYPAHIITDDGTNLLIRVMASTFSHSEIIISFAASIVSFYMSFLRMIGKIKETLKNSIEHVPRK
jgi:hypothetical protein